jgi:hypothetical protein
VAVPRFLFFDVHDDEAVLLDEEGIELPDLEAVKHQAAMSLAELAADVVQGSSRRFLSVQVRDEAGDLVVVATMTFEAKIVGADTERPADKAS